MENYITLNKIVYRIWESIRGKISGNDNINDNLIENDVINIRSIFLRREFGKNRMIDSHVKQKLTNVPVKETRASFDNIGYNKHFLRSIFTLPRTINRGNRNTITAITIGYEDRYTIPLIDFNWASFVGSGRFNNTQSFAFLHSDYLYIYNPYISSQIELGNYGGYVEFFATNITEEGESTNTKTPGYGESGDDTSEYPSINPVRPSPSIISFKLKDKLNKIVLGAKVAIEYTDKEGSLIKREGLADKDGKVDLQAQDFTYIDYTITGDNHKEYKGKVFHVEEGEKYLDPKSNLPHYNPEQYKSEQYK